MNEELLKEAMGDMLGGSAICFLGAGFSYGATDVFGNVLPDSASLGAEICATIGEAYDELATLADLADYCEDDADRKLKLSTLLIKRLTKCKPASSHTRILSMPWRAIFTTNFDDVAENAGGEKLYPVTPVSDISSVRLEKTPIYYLHGRAKDILEGAVNPSLVISERNYLELKDRNKNLYHALENEVHSASRVFFIGYSLKDAEIASRLFRVAGLKAKSIVITGPNERGFTLSRLDKFGQVYPIGVDEFANALPSQAEIVNPNRILEHLQFITEMLPEPALSQVTITNVDKMLLTGEFDYAAYACQMRTFPFAPDYCVPRKKAVSEIFNAATKSANRFTVTADIGNGKSFFLNEVAYEGHERGFRVFKIETQLTEIYKELDLLMSEPSRKIFLIDSLVRYRRVVEYIGK